MNNGNILGGIENIFNQPLGQVQADIGALLNGMINMQPVQVTLTENALDALEDFSYEQIKEKLVDLAVDEQCPICLDKLDENPDTCKYAILPCNHVYHNNCIKEYLKDYDYHCPVCKRECGEHAAKID